nr:MAG TPA: hypothetical protein [Caudoviricetes sp.]
MPLQRLTAYTVGRFSFLILVTSATTAPISARRLCSTYGGRPYRATLDAGHNGPRSSPFLGRF